MTQLDDSIQETLEQAKTIGLLGVSSRPDVASFGVAKYLQSQGYQLVPITDRDDSIVGFPTVPTLAQTQPPIDVLAVFLNVSDPPSFRDEVSRLGVKAMWAQPGCSKEVHAACQQSGVPVFMDRCIMRDHERLLTHSQL